MEAVAHPLTTPAKSLEVYDRFLAEEAALKLPEVELADRARFHFAVRQCALAWSRHPRSGFHITRTRHALALSLDGPIEGKQLSLITFRSACEHGDYRFQGFNLANLPATLSPIARGNLQRLKDLYEAALPQTYQSDGAVTVSIKRQPSIDFLPILDEARRLLDDGNQDFPPIDPRELMIVPAEHARMFVGKTTVIPIVRPKVEPPKPGVKAVSVAGATKAKSDHHAHSERGSDEHGSDHDPDSDSDSDSEGDSESETESNVAKPEPKSTAKPKSPAKAAPAPVPTKQPLAKSPAAASTPTVAKAVAAPNSAGSTKVAGLSKATVPAKSAVPPKAAAHAKSSVGLGQAGVKASQAPAKSAPKSATPSASKPAAKVVGKPHVKTPSKPVIKAASKAPAKPVSKPAAKAAKKAVSKPPAKSAANSAGKAAPKPAAKAAAKKKGK